MTEEQSTICPIWTAIIQNVGYSPHPWDIAREGSLTGVDAAVREIRAYIENEHDAPTIRYIEREFQKEREAFFDMLRDKVIAAYIQGAEDVHENWQEDRDPDFSEAAHDYYASLTDIGLNAEVQG